MASTKHKSSSRPLSPHLSVYRLPLLPVLSILNRVAGVGLVFGTIAVSIWLGSLGMGEVAFTKVSAFMGSPFGLFLLVSWSLALMYHGLAGIRHLFWDAGYGFAPHIAEASGKALVILTLVGTLALWLLVWIVK